MPYIASKNSCRGFAQFVFVRALPALLLLPIWVGAQTTNKETQATYDPPSAPGAGQRFLQNFVGNWAVERKFHPRNGEPTSTKGECHQAMIADGRFLQSDFVFHNGTTNVTGLGLIGFEPATGFFTSTWIDSSSTRMSIRHSKAPFNGSEIVMYSQALDSNGPREARPSRNETHITDDHNKIVHQQFATNPDGSERLVLELILTRTGP